MKTVLPFILLLCRFSTFAQHAIFLQPLAGCGIGNSKFSNNPAYNSKTKDRLVYEIRFGGGYVYKDFVLSASVGYKRSSVDAGDAYVMGFGSTSRAVQVFNHISAPVTIGYQIRAGKHSSIVPAIGAVIAYNYSSTLRVIDSRDNVYHTEKLPDNIFKQLYQPVSVWGLAQVNMDFVVSRKLSISCGPSVDYMVDAVGKGSAFPHNYNMMLNGGVKWYLHDMKNAVTRDSKNKKQ